MVRSVRDPIQNLLRLDCIACHANDPTGGTKLWTMPGGSVVPQVAHGGGTDDLAGGNFTIRLLATAARSITSSTCLHGQWDTNAGDPADTRRIRSASRNSTCCPLSWLTPGPYSPLTFATPFDAFTCAGARGCHGTRSQFLSGDNS